MPEITTIPFLSAADLNEGDVVEFIDKYTPKFRGKTFRVTNVLKKNVDVVDEQGSEVRTDPFLLMKSDKPFRPVEGPGLMLGSLVRLKPRNAGKWGDTLFSVTSRPANGKVQLAKVGGDRNRHLAGVSVRMLDVVDPADVLR